MTGSMLIWDTGEYSILPYHGDQKRTDVELSTPSSDEYHEPEKSDSEKLHDAFKSRKIRIRLHGTRLPPDYTLSMRLLAANNRHEQPKKPMRKRRRHNTAAQTDQRRTMTESSDTDDQTTHEIDTISAPINAEAAAEIDKQEDEEVRRTNAYPGATNSINSIHQRRWYLSMDRHASGFTTEIDDDGNRRWVRRREGSSVLGFESFVVRGRDYERSVVTGRTADAVMRDERVGYFQGRKGWRAVLG
ncbi:MAG: hypothetical protein Q9182_006151 [Xanthomendoza sp. 2 TL-2023]